jgi:hypothetical protein
LLLNKEDGRITFESAIVVICITQHATKKVYEIGPLLEFAGLFQQRQKNAHVIAVH